MNTNREKKQLVQQQYGKIAETNSSGGCCSAEGVACIAESYDQIKGYSPDADLGLGCGLPTSFAKIQEGQTVVDLGSGAGNDCFVARAQVGATGKVIGVDFTEKMINKARINAEKLGYNNVEFRLGDIEDLPVVDDAADVIISNCVLNLVPDKVAVLDEIYRVLRPGGHFSISDVVIDGMLPSKLMEVAEYYIGCVSGAWTKRAYLAAIEKAGFSNITIQAEKLIDLPDRHLEKYLSKEEIHHFRESSTNVVSLTVYGEKALNAPKKSNISAKEACCEPGCCGN